MTDLFVPYQESLELKELGFNEPCFIYWVYDGIEITYSTSHNKSGWSMIGFKNSQMSKKAGLCTTPTFSQAFKFFREKHQLNFECKTPDGKDGKWFPAIHKIYGFGNYFDNEGFETYEQAELECLRKLIEICKNTN